MSATDPEGWVRETCRAKRAHHHSELEHELAGIPRVESVERQGPLATEHGHPQTTVIARATRWGSCPNAMLVAVLKMGLTIASIESLDDGRVRVTIR